MSRRRRGVVIGVVLVVVLLAAGLWALRGSDSDGRSLADRLGFGDDKSAIEGSGFIESPQVDVASELPGKVGRVLVAEGDRVQEGDPLVVLENPVLDAQVSQAQAGVQSAQAQLDRVRAGARSEVVAQVRDAEASALAARDDAGRALQGAPAGPAQDAARVAYDAAVLAVEAASAQRALVEAGPSEYQMRVAEAALRQAQARLQRVQTQRDRLTLRAPRDGVVGSVAVSTGDSVQPAAPLLRVGPTDPVELTIYVPEPRLGEVSLGGHATVTADAIPDETFEATVASIGTSAEFTPRNVQTAEGRADLVFAVRLRIPNKAGTLRPGMAADAVIEAE